MQHRSKRKNVHLTPRSSATIETLTEFLICHFAVMATTREYWEKHRYLIDPHTAVCLAAAKLVNFPRPGTVRDPFRPILGAQSDLNAARCNVMEVDDEIACRSVCQRRTRASSKRRSARPVWAMTFGKDRQASPARHTCQHRHRHCRPWTRWLERILWLCEVCNLDISCIVCCKPVLNRTKTKQAGVSGATPPFVVFGLSRRDFVR